ncbi:hypothetical protein [Solirubrum puertoriconensis]|uniref:Uncharacterized protein n=1 Tax=Solirubrum puertoriconensis TaxID=1751427 RepID=A0A9X0HHB8_SOLP1|nr:hypothetical protein [Solirubrum puertoriconensis]KUG05860.1 hypothetical protein ASU33_00270 [Solirubrum puertoriconensis]
MAHVAGGGAYHYQAKCRAAGRARFRGTSSATHPGLDAQLYAYTKQLYEKFITGQPITEQELAGRLLYIDQQVATPTQLRALTASRFKGVSVITGHPELLQTYGEQGRNGIIRVYTK